MPRKTKSSLRNRPSIEPLEQRAYLAMFANGIDSDNMGKGVWAWGLRSTMTNMGFSQTNYSGFFNHLKNVMGADYVITKAADGGTITTNGGVQNYNSTAINAARAAGLKILPYFYIRGADVTGEINVFNTIINSLGADGVILDIEGEYKSAVPNPQTAILQYFNGIGKSAAGDGSGSRDNLFIAYSSFPYPVLHRELPWRELGDHLDAAMPQAYWAVIGTTPSGTIATDKGTLRGVEGVARMVSNVNDEYAYRTNTFNPIFNDRKYVKPVIMTGQSYGTATAEEIEAFNAAVKASTTAVGNGGFSGYRYKSVNWFDLGTAGQTTNAQRNAISATDIGDLPGVPSSPSPANGASNVNRAGLVLNWADVVNTYVTPTTGAATSYDVYLDNMTTPAATNLTVSQWTVPTQLAGGAHSWKVVARNMMGTTTGPTWTFNVAPLPAPSTPSNPSPDNVILSARPVLLDWSDSTNATLYDVFVNGGVTPLAANLTSSQYNWVNPADGVHTWRVVAKNSETSTTGPTWSFTLDTTPPTASYGGESPAHGASFLDFTVTYADATTSVDASSLDDNDILVTGPNGYSAAAVFISLSGATATYRIPAPAPGGTWSLSDNGSYVITQNASQVKDIAGNFRPPGTIGTIDATLPFAWMVESTLHVQFDGSTVPIRLANDGDTIVATRDGVVLTFAGVSEILAAGTDGADVLEKGTLAPPLTFDNRNGQDVIRVVEGSRTFAQNVGGALRNVAVIVEMGASVTFDATQRLRGLVVNGSATLSPGGDKVLITDELSVAGRLDLMDNDLVLRYATISPIGTWTGSQYDGLAGLIAAGRNEGDWAGNGIVTSMPEALTEFTTLALAEAGEVLGISGSETAEFAGETVDARSVLIKYTYAGDANLDGVINIDDYGQIDFYVGLSGVVFGYFNGDFNYDGLINIDDYGVIDFNVGIQGLPL